MFVELQIRGQAIRDDWCQVEPSFCCSFVSPHLSSLAANSQTSNLPQILTRHRSTAERRVVGIEPSRTESLIEEPAPESNDLAMSCLCIRERIISSCVGLAPTSLNVCTRHSQTCAYVVQQSGSMTYQV